MIIPVALALNAIIDYMVAKAKYEKPIIKKISENLKCLLNRRISENKYTNTKTPKATKPITPKLRRSCK